ncbi:ubiquitin carboxyl-terminal hydrolase 47 [Scaptodrosophila lebanonensis]|uniref:Ubiquitin carboxyl-terminal hydrolase 47 n=1 Tax=Drosophila lebanonensis TaxID=7225 RepID=A0A6J2TG21_DROLE|nr:ubiquitin carboxyl-terminal hydrolase 47 [Scaptodrosophila lebanonensis]XP_030375682.1 ubiquitin carboxyl-terminal hydrolase 47 [Scaptodrosophila lebanonensis]
MTDQDNESTQCAVFDQTPGSQQKKINLVVRSHYTVQRVISDISTQYAYSKFELLLQPYENKDLVYLNKLEKKLLYEVPGFERSLKNFLVLLPAGTWNGDVSKRYELPMKQAIVSAKSNAKATSQVSSTATIKTPSTETSTAAESTERKEKKSVAKTSPSKAATDTSAVTSNGVTVEKKKRVTGEKKKKAAVSPTKSKATPASAATTVVASAVAEAPVAEEPPTSVAPTVRSISPKSIDENLLLHPVIHPERRTPAILQDKLPENRILISPVYNNTEPELFNISPVSDAEPLSDDDLALGASASPTLMGPGYDFSTVGVSEGGSSSAGDGGDGNGERSDVVVVGQGHEPAWSSFYRRKYGGDDLGSLKNVSTAADFVALATTETDNGTGVSPRLNGGPRGYVGLVNQAMTCYLNSLLQALFMTPEFRNALYRWEFDNDNEAKNIPYQLQKLFLNLQTSPKPSVETTDLTRSFGWDSTEAWQQHDIQELCRVMFDALEHKFKNTKQANLISTLYEGKMNDYVKCLECNTEKTREDTFLDIPLPVRPFGSNSAYGSIEEALRAFVQPETLDGNNQYLCEKCNKKCDAHKGLKFKAFPYILTLHLKRFDFDYQTMHRIKLNDRVTFPQTLNLNSFISRSENAEQYQLNGSGVTNIDDCSTADSGSAMEEDNLSSGVVTTASSSQHENDMNDEDEGIDMSTSTNKSAHMERLKQESGPYIYELFAIMIHSGSASGGHYYAYIKDFDSNEWFCFNDQNVSSITLEDIQRSFGGPNGSYYSSAYTSSTNAYMLMYRQVDAKRNENAAKCADFPEHIKTLLPKLHAEEDTRVARLGRHTTVTDLALPDLYKPRVYFYNPSLKKLKMTRVYVSQSFDVNLVLMSAYEMLNVEQFAPISRCRLVAYDSSTETIIQSLENCSDPALTELRAAQDYSLDFLLEFRAEDQQFEIYETNGTTWYVYVVDLAAMAMDGPFLVSSAARDQSDVLRHSIAVRLHINEEQFLLATVRGTYRKAFVAYDPRPTAEAQQQLQNMASTQFKYLTYFYLNVPNTDASTLEILGVPTSEGSATQSTAETSNGGDVVDAALMNGSLDRQTGGDASNDCDWRRYKRDQPPATNATVAAAPGAIPGHESNSEDSSLSDGDRTLVESMQNRGGGDSQVSSTSHSPQLSSPEDEAASHDAMMRVQAYCNGNSYADVDPSCLPPPTIPHFFYACKIDCVDAASSSNTTSGHQSDDEAALRKPTRSFKLLVGTQMRMGAFKKHIEQLIRIPGAYFRLQRKHENTISNSLNNSLVFLNEGETLTVELGKTLQADEYKAKIFFMRLSDLDNETAKLPSVCEWVYNTTTTVEAAKQELVGKMHRIDAKYATLTVANCRIWLKGGRCPIKILANDETLSCDMRTIITPEFIIQECEEGVNPQPKDDALTIFVRRWYPDKWEFGKFQEITIDKDSEIRSTLSQICDIPVDNISYMKVNTNFPCTSISAMSVNEEMRWCSVPATLDVYPLTTTLTGNMYLYKDIKVPVRELSLEERRQLSAKEKARLDRLGCISTTRYSQRRERALKIYLDSPEKTSNVTASAPMDAYAN